MNRYTFKAKRKDNGEWVDGHYMSDDKCSYIVNESHQLKYERISEIYSTFYEIIPETLCQCTGLQDVDGNYIFENDIVSGYGNVFKATVEWNTSFCGFYPFCNEETKIFADECKIISNKFDKEVE